MELGRLIVRTSRVLPSRIPYRVRAKVSPHCAVVPLRSRGCLSQESYPHPVLPVLLTGDNQWHHHHRVVRPRAPCASTGREPPLCSFFNDREAFIPLLCALKVLSPSPPLLSLLCARALVSSPQPIPCLNGLGSPLALIGSSPGPALLFSLF